jgi:hypothetical protein
VTAILHDEKLAELLDEGATGARSWGLELHYEGGLKNLTRTVEKVLAANRVIDRLYVPCPQEALGLCPGNGTHDRVFECEHRCGFTGCGLCIEAHEKAAHAEQIAKVSRG